MSDYGDFSMNVDLLDPINTGDIHLDQLDDDDEFFQTLDMSFLDFLASTTPSNTTMVKMEEELKQPEMSLTSRFHSVTEEQMKSYEEARQSKSTKSNTKWAIKIFQEWHSTTYGIPFDVMTVSEESLSQVLRRFYCEAKPKETQHRTKSLGEHATTYHKNTMKNIRAAINRHLQDNGRNIDIIRGPAFKSANNTLDGLLKEQTRAGMSRPTQHKEIIEEEDLYKMSDYVSTADSNPVILRQSVWLNLSIHFVSRGLEFHHQLKRDSFDFKLDDNGTEYVTINHETQQKNFQGGLTKDEAPIDRRMYATGDQNCPVKSLKLFIEKTDPNAKSLFNNCYREALTHPQQTTVWYGTKGLAKRTFTNFMADISKGSGLSKIYTPHCLRATAIQAMNDNGFSSRHIMFMSGHRCEESLKPYTRNPSSKQKKALSTTLASVVQPNRKLNETAVEVYRPQTQPSTFGSSAACARSDESQNLPVQISGTSTSNTANLSSLFQSGSFHSCSFNITLNQPN